MKHQFNLHPVFRYNAISNVVIWLTFIVIPSSLLHAGNIRPTVSITKPLQGDLFTEPATIVIEATALDPDGTIKNVAFYNGTKLIGLGTSIGNNKYSFTWSNVATGIYLLKAKAVDNLGKQSNWNAVTILVDQSHILNTSMTSGTRYMDKVFAPEQIKITEGIVYGGAVNNAGQWQDLSFDLYEPDPQIDSEAHRPLIVIIHPGGFARGASNTPGMVEWAKEWFAPRGYVAASINYRLTQYPINIFSNEANATSDAQAAIRFFRAHASEYRIDPNRIVTMGESAGAITSEMVAISSEIDTIWEELYPDVIQDSSNPGYPSWVPAAISVAGRVTENFLNDQLDSTDAGTVLDFHGTMDSTVDYDSAVVTIAAFNAKGIDATLYSYNDTHHTDFSDSDDLDIENKSVQMFFDRVIQGDQCPAPNMTVSKIPWVSGLNPSSDLLRTEMNNDETDVSFDIYPNPARESFKILFSSTSPDPLHCLIVITDEKKNKMLQRRLTLWQDQVSEAIHLSDDFIPGMYWVHLIVGNEVVSRPLIVSE